MIYAGPGLQMRVQSNRISGNLLPKIGFFEKFFQKEMDEIVGNSFNKNKVDKKTTGDGVAFAAQGEGEEEFEYF